MNRSCTHLTTFLLVAAALGVLAPVQADAQKVRRELEAIYSEQARIWAQNDPAKMAMFAEQTSTPDFTFTFINGEVQPRAEAIRNLKSALRHWPDYRSVQSKMSYQIKQLDVAGDVATVLAQFQEKHTGVDPQGKQHQELHRGSSRSTWVRTPDNWRCRSEEALEYEVYKDGRLTLRESTAEAAAQSELSPEMKKLRFLVGKWKATPPGPGALFTENTWVRGTQYLHLRSEYRPKSGGMVHSVYLLSYDPGRKRYRMWTFGGTDPAPDEYVGDFHGSQLVLVGKQLVPNVEVRFTFEPKSQTTLMVRQEVKKGQVWGNADESLFTLGQASSTR